jgi:hypothetical protein
MGSYGIEGTGFVQREAEERARLDLPGWTFSLVERAWLGNPPPAGFPSRRRARPGAGPRRRSRRGEPRAHRGRRGPNGVPEPAEGEGPEPGHGGEAGGANPAQRVADGARTGFPSRRRARPGAGPRRRSRRGEPRAHRGRRGPNGVPEPAEGKARSRATAAKPAGRTPRSAWPTEPERGSRAGGGQGPEPGHGGEAGGANPAHTVADEARTGFPSRRRARPGAGPRRRSRRGEPRAARGRRSPNGVPEPAEGRARSRATAAKPAGRTPRSAWPTARSAWRTVPGTVFRELASQRSPCSPPRTASADRTGSASGTPARPRPGCPSSSPRGRPAGRS